MERRLNLLQGELAQLTQAANRETFLIHDHFRRYVIDGTSESQIEFTFPRFNSPDKQFINLTYPSYGNTITPRPHPIFELSALFSSETEDLFRTEIEGPAGGVATPYSMDLFVNAARNAPGYDINTTTAQRKYFPFAYGMVVDQIFDYYTENGIFDAATLQSLNFFHDNANCAADDVADLLDVSGIFQQMQQEYVEEACNNNPPTSRERMREVIKFGMFLLLVQVHVAEFVIKNIFVFAAVQLDELFAKDFIESYMRAQVNDSIQNYFSNINEEEKVTELKEAMVTIFNRMMTRPNVIAAGGVTDAEGQVVFPAGTVFVVEGQPASVGPESIISTFNDIVSFVALYRIQTSMGTTASPGPVSNALKNSLPVVNQKSMEEIFLASMPVLLMGGADVNALGAEDTVARARAKELLRSGLGDRDGIVIIKSLTSTEDPDSDAGDPQYNFPNAEAEHYRNWILNLFPQPPTSLTIQQLMAVGLGDYYAFLSTYLIDDPRPIGEQILEQIDAPALGRPPAWSNIITRLELVYANDTAAQDDLADVINGLIENAQLFQDMVMTYEEEARIRYDFWFVANDYVNRIGTPAEIEWHSIDDETVSTGPARDDATGRTANMVAFRLFGWESLNQNNEDLTTDSPQLISLTEEEMERILVRPAYQAWFTEVFDREIISMLPIIHNFYLTNHYFRDIPRAMRSTKNRVLEIINSTIDNHNSYNQVPQITRPAARQAALQNNSELDPEAMARDFIIQMLIKTPIDILKGIIQMIDPHLVISKFIKLGSGEAFNIIQSQMRQIDLPSVDENPAAPFAPGATGADLFTALLCLMQWLMENPTLGPDNAFELPEPPENFFPRINEEGIDFLGTGMGMMMIPPTPLGLIYLLLSLINFDTQQGNVDVGINFGPNQINAEGTDASACEDNLVATTEEQPAELAALESVRPPYVIPEE